MKLTFTKDEVIDAILIHNELTIPEPMKVTVTIKMGELDEVTLDCNRDRDACSP